MAKHPNRKVKAAKADPMTGAMKFFLAGGVAELYLLIVRRFYINGSLEQVVAWDSHLKIFAWIGAAVLAIGAVLSILWKADSKKRVIGWYTAGFGAFLAVASFLIQKNMSLLSPLSVLIFVVMLLGILWTLYDRECALALTVLALSLVAVWVCRRGADSLYLGSVVTVLAIVYILALLVLVWLVKGKKLSKLLPAKADPLPVYVACSLSVVTVAAALISSTVAYYAMWVLAAVVFALAVYYTVKQL